ncbi:MAG: F0F1 ATP synthase subunit delta [Demequinaceae bacterium]|nr:F0F1 ATP synthase subunit delta [Demequinaceae bacterium]
MRGMSQASRNGGMEAFEPVATAAGREAPRLAVEIFSVVDLLDSSNSLRHALTDPARPGTDKGTLVTALFSRLDPRVRAVVEDFASRRWWHEHDLGDALEDAAVEALLISAEADGSLDTVEGELFRIERLLASERDLYSALDNRAALPAARVELARTLLGSRVTAVTAALIERVCTTTRGHRLVKKLWYFQKAAAARRMRTLAHVTVAVELTPEQEGRLAATLGRRYGRDIALKVTVDPGVMGGMKVQVGHQVTDGTLLARLGSAREILVG